jgi:DNA polymerase III delta subunit
VHGKRLDGGGATRLRELVGDSLGALDNELSKLALYVGSRPAIAVADVEALVGHHREETVFAVLDAIAEGDPSRALQYWEQVLATDRAAPGRAVGGLAWGIRRLLSAKRALGDGAPLAQVARQHWTDPDIMRRRLDRVTIEDLERRLADLLEADLAAKTGFSTVPRAVEKFIVKHTVAQ